jgi:uncharacterized protein (DUF3820 family)
MNVIGFATEFYTLWDMQEEKRYQTDAYGKQWLVETTYRYFYIRNISTSIEKVKSQYPNTCIDKSLHGIQEREWHKVVRSNMPDNYLSFGKYKGRTVEDVATFDFQYLLWVLDNGVESLCNSIKATHQYKEWEANEQAQVQEKLKAIQPLSDGVCRLTLLHNPINGCAIAEIASNHRVEFRFAQTKECFYNGFSYELPIINGKAKRVKGKEIEYNIQVVDTQIDNRNGNVFQIVNVINP